MDRSPKPTRGGRLGGLGSLVTALAGEAQAGIEAALAEQARTAAERMELLDLSVEEFADRCIDEQAVLEATREAGDREELGSRREVCLRLAARERSLLESLHRQGMPRVLVESGTVTVPLRFASVSKLGEVPQAGAEDRSSEGCPQVEVSYTEADERPGCKPGELVLTFRTIYA